MIVLEGLEHKDVQYCEEKDFYNIETTVSLLDLYGYIENDEYVALPFLKNVPAKEMYKIEELQNLFIENDTIKKKREGANVILADIRDGRWVCSMNLFRQVLNYLEFKKDEIENAEQRKLFNLAKAAWDRETMSALRNPTPAPLDKPYIQ
jgi:hypothetical protein